MPASRDDISPGLIIWLTYGALMVVALVAGSHVLSNDFYAFYESGRHVLTGATSESSRPDLNTPTFAWLMVPFALLPAQVAFVVWSGLGVAAIIASLRRIARVVPLPVTNLLWIAGGLTATVPAHVSWQEGQITWFVLYFVTRAWSASSSVRAGLWLAPIVMVKPTFAILALCLPVSIWVVTAIVAGLGTLGAAAITGIEPWVTWLAKGREIAWIDHPANASLWGLAARWQNVSTLTDLSAPLVWTVLIVAVMVGVWALRARDRWTAGVAVTTLISPLGWICYLPIALGPVVKNWRPAFVVPLVILVMPPPIAVAIERYASSDLLGIIYVAAVVMLLAISVHRPSTVAVSSRFPLVSIRSISGLKS